MSQRWLRWLAGSVLLAVSMWAPTMAGADAAAAAAPVAAAGGKPSITAPGHNKYVPLPEDISTYGAEVDDLFWLILWITGVTFVFTEGLLIYALLKFRHVQGAKSKYEHGNHKLEIVWTVVPGLILIGLAIYQVGPWRRIKMPTAEENGKDPVRIQVLAKQFEWNFRYPGKDGIFGPRDINHPYKDVDDVYEVKQLYIPKGRRVVVEMRSTDVIHSLFLPNMRFKQDVMPGMTVHGWFQATKTTKEGRAERNNPYFNYEIACAELCGPQHGLMRADLFILEPDEFEQFMEAEYKRQQELEMPAVWDPKANKAESLSWYSWTAKGEIPPPPQKDEAAEGGHE